MPSITVVTSALALAFIAMLFISSISGFCVGFALGRATKGDELDTTKLSLELEEISARQRSLA